MFPLRDTTPRRSFPLINYLLIVVNVIVFFLQLTAADFEQFTNQYAFIPAEFSLFSFASYQSIITSMFLHGNLFHIASNMWFLHIFGDNVEDVLGHIPYLILYLMSGVAAVFLQYIFSFDSLIPMVGASGAISGVAGAYYVFFRDSSIEAIVPTYVFVRVMELPVWFFLGYWFLIQLVSGLGTIGMQSVGGVAFFAHVGGFVFGYLIARYLEKNQL